jgi:hypothetical protein
MNLLSSRVRSVNDSRFSQPYGPIYPYPMDVEIARICMLCNSNYA